MEMTAMQIDRATVEQALHVAESAGYPVALIKALRDALAQQNDPTDPGNDVDVLREHVRHLERRIRELHAQQAEPLEPVAGVVLNEEGRAALVEYGREEWHCVTRNARRLYTAPPKDEPKPMHPELRKMWEDYFDKCFRAMPVPEQAEPVEPVAWMFELARNFNLEGYGGWEKRITEYRPNTPEGSVRNVTPLYTAPPQRKPLTEKEMYAVEEEARKNFRLSQKGPRGQQITYWDGLTPWLIRAVERAHGIKE